ncbi:hypothetical protein A0H81_07563 [Grifola frondosa]|uniref:Uncharacterized protein n=1 Tax=Grifola frondosa TaxID=5627 RepID=A0A1C7M5M5_GRIFR|nr:hypothetical protein A0H81_07563 [Grifola frondosa]
MLSNDPGRPAERKHLYVTVVRHLLQSRQIFPLEGVGAKAARLAVAQHLNVKVFLDDNDVAIAGHPSQYLKGYCLNEDAEELWTQVKSAVK